MNFRIALLLLISLLISTKADAQDPPGSDLFLLAISEQGPLIDSIKNITQRSGYDNQPSFSTDGKRVFFTRIEDGNADIWYYDLETGMQAAVAKTSDSEYSPTPIPGRDALSVVRVESDQKQRLWALSLKGEPDKLLLPSVEPVGYHAWVSPEQLVLFVLGEPHTLQGATLGKDQTVVLAENIGRGMQALPSGGEAAFIQIKDNDQGHIAIVDAQTTTVRKLLPTRPGSQDFAIDGKGQLWMGENGRLFTTNSSSGGDWQLAADLTAKHITNITRLAIHPDGTHIVFVADEPAPAAE